MFGLGLYIYAGEDLPMVQEEVKEEPKVDQQKVADLTLFAEALPSNLSLYSTEKELMSYWKANQTKLEEPQSPSA
jgi:hypothetical protein